MSRERWKAIPGHEHYEASTHGRVRRVGSKREALKPYRSGKIKPGKQCYLKVGLSQNGERKQEFVHRLVWITWRGPIPEGREVNHRDTDKTNNALSNLELLTPLANRQHAVQHGLVVLAISDNDVAIMRAQYALRPEPCRSLAKRFGISKSQAYDIVTMRARTQPLEKPSGRQRLGRMLQRMAAQAA